MQDKCLSATSTILKLTPTNNHGVFVCSGTVVLDRRWAYSLRPKNSHYAVGEVKFKSLVDAFSELSFTIEHQAAAVDDHFVLKLDCAVALATFYWLVGGCVGDMLPF